MKSFDAMYSIWSVASFAELSARYHRLYDTLETFNGSFPVDGTHRSRGG